MNIGILGSGNVGQSLGRGFVKNGHPVMIGTRHPEKLKDWQDDVGESASLGSFEQAASFGAVLVLAVKGSAALNVLQGVKSEHLSGKTIIDATNPIADTPPVNGVLNFFTDQNGSLMEELQAAFPSANFVKAFSCVGAALMVNPAFSNAKPTMFIAGNNDNAKLQVKEILNVFGWDYEDMGAAEAARAIEPLCKLWCIPGFLQNRWTHAFALLNK